MVHEVRLETRGRDEMLDITARVASLVAEENVQEGLAVVFSAHTTAGVTINENADPDVQKDFLRRLEEIYPWDQGKDLHREGNSAAHMKTSTVGACQTVIIEKGRLLLGRWQGIYFCEFDGPRQRTCYVRILSK